jgi:hypothetical protein
MLVPLPQESSTAGVTQAGIGKSLSTRLRTGLVGPSQYGHRRSNLGSGLCSGNLSTCYFAPPGTRTRDDRLLVRTDEDELLNSFECSNPWPLMQRERQSIYFQRRFHPGQGSAIGCLNSTSRGNDEILYDTRYDHWAPSRYALGAEFPVRRHVCIGAFLPTAGRQPLESAHIEMRSDFKLNLFLGGCGGQGRAIHSFPGRR